MVVQEDSTIAIIVEQLNMREHLDGGGLVQVPRESQLLTFASHFGPTVHTFVTERRYLPAICHAEDGCDADDEMENAICAATNGAYLLSADGGPPSPVNPDDLTPDSALWDNKLLRFSPMLPFCTREAGLHYVHLCVHWRRIEVGRYKQILPMMCPVTSLS